MAFLRDSFVRQYRCSGDVIRCECLCPEKWTVSSLVPRNVWFFSMTTSADGATRGLSPEGSTKNLA